LIIDLKRRGLLDETLVTWHPNLDACRFAKGVGRDHNPGAMTVWMAAIKQPDHRRFDDFGWKAQDQKVPAHDPRHHA
jgi:hypothetical protein